MNNEHYHWGQITRLTNFCAKKLYIKTLNVYECCELYNNYFNALKEKDLLQYVIIMCKDLLDKKIYKSHEQAHPCAYDINKRYDLIISEAIDEL